MGLCMKLSPASKPIIYVPDSEYRRLRERFSLDELADLGYLNPRLFDRAQERFEAMKKGRCAKRASTHQAGPGAALRG